MSRDFLYWTHDVHDVLLHFKWSLPLSMEVVFFTWSQLWSASTKSPV